MARLDPATLERYQNHLSQLGEQALSLDAVDGFLTALVLSPEAIELGKHYAEITGGAAPGPDLIEWLHQHQREIRLDLHEHHLRDPILLMDDDAEFDPIDAAAGDDFDVNDDDDVDDEFERDDSLSLARWLLGFAQGMALARPAWQQALDQEALEKIAAPLLVLLGEIPALMGEEASELSDDAYADCCEDLPLVLGEIDSYFKSQKLTQASIASAPAKLRKR
jgi:hypothetical protein